MDILPYSWFMFSIFYIFSLFSLYFYHYLVNKESLVITSVFLSQHRHRIATKWFDPPGPSLVARVRRAGVAAKLIGLCISCSLSPALRWCCLWLEVRSISVAGGWRNVQSMCRLSDVVRRSLVKDLPRLNKLAIDWSRIKLDSENDAEVPLWTIVEHQVMPWLQLRFDYDPTTTYRTRQLLPFDVIRHEQKMNINFSS